MEQGQSQFEDNQMSRSTFRPYSEDQTPDRRIDHKDDGSQIRWQDPSPLDYQTGYAEQVSSTYDYVTPMQGEKLVPGRKRKRKLPKPLIYLFVCLLIITIPIGGSIVNARHSSIVKHMSAKTAETIYKVGSIPTLIIHDEHDQLNIHTGDNPNAQAVIINTATRSSLTSKLDGNTINITDAAPDGNIDITVPKKVNLKIVANDGYVIVEGVDGKVDIATQTAPVRLDASTLSTSSQVTTISAALTVGAEFDPKGNYLFTSSSGDITVETSPGTPAHFINSTVNGKIHNDENVDSYIHGNQAQIHVRTVDGSIFLGNG
jgi:hypothetical protein